MDGVFARNRAGVLNLPPTQRPTALDVAEVLSAVEHRIKRLLDRHGLWDSDDDGGASDAWADEAPVLAGLAAAAVHQLDSVRHNRGETVPTTGKSRQEGQLHNARQTSQT